MGCRGAHPACVTLRDSMSPPTARLGPDKHSDTNKYKIDTQNSARNALLYLKHKVLIIFFKKYCIYHNSLRVRYLLKLVNNVISFSRPISGVINIGYERSSLYFYLLCGRQNYVTGNVLIMHL